MAEQPSKTFSGMRQAPLTVLALSRQKSAKVTMLIAARYASRAFEPHAVSVSMRKIVSLLVMRPVVDKLAFVPLSRYPVPLISFATFGIFGNFGKF